MFIRATGTRPLRVLAPKTSYRALLFRILGAGVTPAEGAGRAASLRFLLRASLHIIRALSYIPSMRFSHGCE